MKKFFYLPLCFAMCFIQCKEKKDIIPVGIIKEIDVIEFSVPGVAEENIIIGKDIIVVNLPENYSGGDFIKPNIRLAKEYSTRSDLINGFNFQDKKLSLLLESTILGSRSYTICVIPFHPVKLVEAAKDYKIVIEPDASINVPLTLNGTSETVSDSGKIVYDPILILTNKTTGLVATRINGEKSEVNGVKNFNFKFPPNIAPDEYTADILWGTKKEMLSNKIVVESGPLKLRPGSWNMLPDDKYFEISGYNISSKEKYELTIENDFLETVKIPLTFKNSSTLSGNLPKDIPTGNYKATYLEGGKIINPIDHEITILKYMGDDNFFIRDYSNQPVLKIISQPSQKKLFQSTMGFSLDYFESVKEISRNEPLMAYINRTGAFPDKNDLVLVNIDTRKEYTLNYTGDFYGIFDGFVVFLSYKISPDIPDGKYEAYAVTGSNNDRSEKYSQVLSIK
ncbi:hypothetical protein [Dyadobacter sp. 3J3]|uniref:hypothetical protein n=1 Tax=Dyadobacter sp. 3J3 TaxID=2606600 RepID=UPI00135B53CD|nr:hypothetical protein [Dyadobacter sp. 3J3]